MFLTINRVNHRFAHRYIKCNILCRYRFDTNSR